MTRAMVVTVLWRIEGSPEPSPMTGFSDVAVDQWYAKAVCWASGNGIVQGYNGKFDPDAQISREQLATILYRYSASPETSGTISQFTDSNLSKHGRRTPCAGPANINISTE